MNRDLSRLLSPKSVAVIGGGVWCASVIEQLAKIGFEGEIFAIHPKRKTVGGKATLADITALPHAPDAAFIGINRHATVDAVRALAAMGAGGAVCFASGFSEALAEDGDAAQLQTALIKAAGEMPILGPNCYGFVNALDRVAIWPDQHGLKPVQSGVAILTQSSNIAINLSMQRRGLPIAALVTVGNQAQTDMAQIARALLDDDRITALGLHIEGIKDIAAFEVMAQQTSKPIVALKVGRSAQAQTAAVSHTASLAGSAAGSDALLSRLGVGQAQNLSAFLDALHILHSGGALSTPRIGSLSCSGGEASLMADTGLRQGLEFPPLTAAQQAALSKALGPMVALANPLDYHTYIWGDVAKMTSTFAAMADPSQEMTVLVLDLPHEGRCDPKAWDCASEALIAAARQTGHRYAVATSLPENLPEPAAQRLSEAGIVPFFDLDTGLAAIKTAADCAPERRAEPTVQAPPPCSPAVLLEHDAKALLKSAGLHVGANALCQDAVELTAFTIAHPGPFVLKTTGAAHKSENGGVRLNITARDAAKTAADLGFPLLVEEMITGGIVELLVSVIRDPAHGFVLTLGAGGIYTEILQDTCHLLIPASRSHVEAALQDLKIAPMLAGYRGKPAIGRAPLLDNIEALQSFVIANAHRIEEVEINPMICTKDDAIVADALIRMEVP